MVMVTAILGYVCLYSLLYQESHHEEQTIDTVKWLNANNELNFSYLLWLDFSFFLFFKKI